jgi:hypothetical protein
MSVLELIELVICRFTVMPVKTGIQTSFNSWIPGRASFASLPGMTLS